MTAYKNFIQDFPLRALEILDRHFDSEQINNREFTLLVTIATSAFIIPFERLRAEPIEHPAGDAAKYKKAKDVFNKASNRSFLQSHRWGQGKSWLWIENINGNEVRSNSVEQWARLELRQPLDKKMVANKVFAHIRNSLAHGSIFTYPSYSNLQTPVQIEEMVFLSRYHDSTSTTCQNDKTDESNRIDQYSILIVSPSDFCAFLQKWIQFLKSLCLHEAGI